MTYRKKLIEVALPLEAINKESAREKSIRHGHPSTLHLWWARRPLAACRAVLFASLVDDPSSRPEEFPTEEAQEQERQRLFRIIEELVKWENVNNERVLNAARAEILKSTDGNPPPVYDPFCGGGSIPLEAQRLGLEAHASDLNPVAVLITKALIEIPPKFKDMPPVNPEAQQKLKVNQWKGAQGLAEDVRYYGKWMRDEAEKRIGHLYPKVKVSRQPDGSYLPVDSPASSPIKENHPHPPTPSPIKVEGEQERWEISVVLKKRMTEIARQFRKEPTQSEEILWQALRSGQLAGRKFRRQQPIGSFVVDFFCASEQLIVEVDGSIHDHQQELDRDRQTLLESLGLRFVRVSAKDVETNLSACLNQIQQAFTPAANPIFTPLAPRGRGVGGEGAKPEQLSESKGAKPEELTVIAWLWARTVKCPNPTCGCQMPLVRSFSLSTKKGKETWVEPVIDRSQTPPVIQFTIQKGNGKPIEGTVSRKGAVCIACATPVPLDYVRSEGKAGRMGAQMMAIVAEGTRERIYLPPNEEHIQNASLAQPEWKPETDLPEQALGFRVQGYGMKKHADLFTSRQLVALTTFSDLVGEAREQALKDSVKPECYADAVATYLGLSIGRCADFWCTLATWSWQPKNELVGHAFGRQALPMTWDFGEINPFSGSGGNFIGNLDFTIKALEKTPKTGLAKVFQCNATTLQAKEKICFSTDPPYYDNVPYADLSDFFYVWMRRTLATVYPHVLSTVLVPKTEELVADPFRYGGKEQARDFFENGMRATFNQMRASANPEFPTTVYYAFKQSEEDELDLKEESLLRASTGWETMLEGLITSNWQVNGTLPVRTERTGRLRDNASNALASSIVLVCRPRPEDAPQATRRQFLNELQRELPDALKKLQQGNIAPVDLAQASIGPGMAIFSRYAKVLEADGSPMRVRTALQLINQTLDEFLSEQEGEFDGDSRWAIAWFEQHQFNEGLYGDAETLSKAKNTAVQGMVNAGILMAKGGKVRLLRRDELPDNWNPAEDSRVPDWEATQHLIRALDQQGETGAANLLAKLGDRGEVAKELAYRLYSICERKSWAQEAVAYNSLVISYPEIARLASEVSQPSSQQLDLMP